MGSLNSIVLPGQLWAEARNVDTSAFRTVRDFIVVAVEGEQVTTVNVDGDAWRWRPELRSWGIGATARTPVAGPFDVTTKTALRHDHFILISDPEWVGCELPAVSVQGTLFPEGL